MSLVSSLYGDAAFSRCTTYRWSLYRVLSEFDIAVCVFIMLNPSTADSRSDDPTIRRCISYAARWGYDVLEVVNLFAQRATNPRDLFRHPDPVGQRNDEYILEAIERAIETGGIIVCAWGAHGGLLDRNTSVLRLIRSAGGVPHVLGLTRAGHPRHPLYMPGTAKPRAWDG